MSIYVIRHGQTDYNLKNIYQGQIDIKLNQTGLQQAEEMAKKFKNLKVDTILVSPLTRAMQTAEPISKVTGITPIIEQGLIERNFGQMEGHANREDCNIAMLLDYDKNYDIYGVEPIQALFKRVYDCMDSIVKKYQHKNIAIVTHAGVAQAIECYFNGFPKNKDLETVTLKNGEVREYSIRKKDEEER